MKKRIMTLSFVVFCLFSFSQTNDTIRVDASKVNTAVLIPGTHRYLVYFRLSKNATRTMTQFWTRTIEKTVENIKQVLVIKQEWEDKDTIVHNTTSVCDALTMQPLKHNSWWKGRGTTEVNFTSNELMYNGKSVTAADTAKNLKTLYTAFQSAQSRYSLNWHLDLEVFPTLPYKKGVTFLIPFYDPRISTPLMEVA